MTDTDKKELKRLNGLARNAKWRASHRDSERLRAKIYREVDPERTKAREKAARTRNRQKRLEYGALYRAANRATIRAKAKAHRLQHQAEVHAKDKAKRLANLERVRQAKAKYRAKKPEKERRSKLAWNARHKEANAAVHLAWARANAGRVNAAAMRYWATKLKATPAWADHNAITAIYMEAARLTRQTGIRYDVDHIVPLQHRDVCGLHVACNLQILTKAENVRKKNKFPHAALS